MDPINLLRYRTSKLFPIGESDANLLNSFKRNLEVRSLKPVPGATYEDLLSRLRTGRFNHVSEIMSLITSVDGPAWSTSALPYAPDPGVLSRAMDAYAVARTRPVYEDDRLDNVLVDEWGVFFEFGKAALWTYCRDHGSATEVRDPGARAEVVRECLMRIDDAASKVVDIPDFANLAISLRLDPAILPPNQQTPTGLLRRFSELVGTSGPGFEVNDPMHWWASNERFIPDLLAAGNQRVVSLGQV